MADGIRFTDLDLSLRQRLARAHVSLLAPSNEPLRSWLLDHLEQAPAQGPGPLVSQPVFEPKFGYQEIPETLAQVGLHPKLLEAMDEAPDAARFGAAWHPYNHQQASWETLKREPRRSIVVSSGTGSGKTECFMVPILDDLMRQAEAGGTLEGVQALFLYPLNALISSQRERLSAWTAKADGRVRFCLYNGETPEDAPAMSVQEVPGRRQLRASPPPVLVTNATMLEYMLVRPIDAPILEKSRGRLKYIVLDEAHTYVGSAAAELSLLLRRVLAAFGVTADQVSFIATSATISSGDPDLDDATRQAAEQEARERVTAFLANVSGQQPGRIDVVVGHQQIPDVPREDAPSPLAHRIRQSMQARGAQSLDELQALTGLSRSKTLELIDVATRATHKGEPFLPLRGHHFVRPLEGVWACCNAECPATNRPTGEDWAWGAAFTTARERCPHCESLVYEVVLCRECGVPFLLAELVPGLPEQLRPVRSNAVDEGDETADLAFENPSSDEEEEALTRIRLIGRGFRKDAGSNLRHDTGALHHGGHPIELLPAPQDGGVLSCSHCNATGQGDRPVWRSASTGQSFVLGVAMPTLLDQLPEDPKHTTRTPFGGRRLITFSDSRQGTARFAAQSQGEVERLYVRSWVYHQLWNDQTSLEPETREDLEDERAMWLQKMEQRPARRAQFEQKIRAIDAQLNDAPTSQSIREVARKLASEPEFDNILRRRRDYAPFKSQHRTEEQHQQFAENLLLREFVRRPTRASSLETLGLARLHPPEGFTFPGAPPTWIRLCNRHGHDAASSWADFLVLFMHFYLRANTIMDVDRDSFRWMGTQIRPKLTTGPGGAAERNLLIPWPRASEKGQPPRLVRLLAKAFRLDPHAAVPELNSVLDASFGALRPMLESGATGHRLRVRELRLSPLQTAWKCPITRKLLDVTLLDHTPYQPLLRKTGERWNTEEWRQLPDTRCEQVALPTPRFAFSRDRASGETVDPAQVESWLESEPVAKARQLGAWSEFADRIAAGRRYFTIAEHSAQIPSRRLRKLEEQFKELKLNVLSCSTTMEMGVDIGGLSAVAMNNAPPNPSNFKQRAGRAGRRGEPRAASLTVCRHLPHEQAVYHRTTWPFRTPIHVTRVSLDKERIVLRHVNALLLRAWLLERDAQTVLTKLQAGWLFGCHDGEASKVEALRQWSSAQETRAAHKQTLVALTAGTACETWRTDQLFRAFSEALDGAEARWREQHVALVEQLEAVEAEPGHEESAAHRAVTRQLRRYEGEYLLGVLAGLQVLPSYGFPTDVLPFVPDTAEELYAAKEDTDGAEDTRRNRYPTRPIKTALAEYVPGRKVVLGGQTYRSAGLTLNWRIPAGTLDHDPIRELQAFSWLWQCKGCGQRGTAQTQPATCPSCGVRGDRFLRIQVLRPAGFTTDIGSRAEVDYTANPNTGEVETWVGSGDGAFVGLGSPTRLEYRHSARGQLLWTHKGPARRGFAICLRCGRTAAMPAEGMPTSLDEHRRLRGRTEGHETEHLCQGSNESYAVKRQIALAGSAHTDVLELRLFQPDHSPLLTTKQRATTLAVALRKVGARLLGLDPREIGFDVRPAPASDDGEEQGWTVLLYDEAAGGAGYCEELAAHLPQLLREAREEHRCIEECGAVCHSCLLSHDTQHHVDGLDRSLLLDVLNDDLLTGLDLPAAAKALGSVTQEWQPPATGLVREARRSGATRARIYLEGELAPADWAGLETLDRLRVMGLNIELVLDPDALGTADLSAHRMLAAMEEVLGIDVLQGVAPKRGPYRVWCQLEGGKPLDLLTDQDGALEMGDRWARGPASTWLLLDRTTALDPLLPCELRTDLPPSMAAIQTREAAKGSLAEFGARLLGHIDKEARIDAQVGSPARRVVYSDRYVRSPLAVAQLRSVIDALAEADWISEHTELWVLTERPSRHERAVVPHRCFDAWQLEETQRAVIARVLGEGAEVEVHRRGSTKGPNHMRSLTLFWDHKVLEIRLDRGLGFASIKADRPFNFTGSVPDQADEIQKLLEEAELVPVEKTEAHGVVHWRDTP